MFRRTKTRQTFAVLFVLLNVAGFVYAAVRRESRHAALHLALAVAGVYFLRELRSRRDQSGDAAAEVSTTALPGEFSDRLTRLEQSLDAAAIEVERIGEGQRFMTRLLTEDRAANFRPDLVLDGDEGEPRATRPPLHQ